AVAELEVLRQLVDDLVLARRIGVEPGDPGANLGFEAAPVGCVRWHDLLLHISETRDADDRRDEMFPAVALPGEDLAPGGGDPVEAPPACARFLDPAPLDELAPLEAVERLVERRDVGLEGPARALLH